ncbi:unnamed protein product, partial [Mesorhabditis spiculigera]
MISIWRQLRYLLWKGYLVKKRQKKWFVAELVTPLVLFIILAIIRLFHFATEGVECHFDSKGFPSAGLLPFTQSFLCSINNKCYQRVTTGDEGFFINEDTSNQSALVRSVRELTTQFENIGSEQALFNDMVGVSVAVLKFLANHEGLRMDMLFEKRKTAKHFRSLDLSPEMADAMAGAYITPRGMLELREYVTTHQGDDLFDLVLSAWEEVPMFCNRTVFDDSFSFPAGFNMTEDDYQRVCGLRGADLGWLAGKLDQRAVREQFEALGLSPSRLGKLSSRIGDILHMFDPLVNIAEMWRGFNASDKQSLYDHFFCGQDPLNTEASSNVPPQHKVTTVFDKVFAPVINFVSNLTPGHDQGTNQTHCGDIKLHDDLACSELESQAIRQLRPLLSGFILVTPDNIATRQLVEKLEAPLREMQKLMDTVKQLAGISGPFQKVLHDSQLAHGLANLMDLLYKYEYISSSTVDEVKKLLGPEGQSGAFGTRLGDIMSTIDKYGKCFMTDRFRFVSNESRLEELSICLQPRQQYFSALVFPEMNPDATDFTNTTVYKIRHAQQLVDGTDSIADSNKNVEPRNHPLEDMKYLTFGWSFLQEAVDRAIIRLTNESVPLGVYSQQEPYPCVLQDQFDVTGFLSFFVVLSWIIPSAMLVKNIVYEKEHKLKELMRIMGLGDTIHFISWAILSLVLNIISALLITIILWAGNILGHTDPSLLFFLLTLFAFSSIAQSLLLTTFFSSSNIATAATALMCLLFSFPFMLSKSIVSKAYSKATLLLPQSAIGYAFQMIGSANKEDVAQWKYVHRMAIAQMDVKMWEVMLALGFHTIFFSILAWYISALFPGVYGVGQRWYFPFTLRYWMPQRFNVTEEASSNSGGPLYDESLGFESEPREGVCQVDIADLTKVYSSQVKALDELTLRLYEGQITALLGHNGAGKTTTMSLLCGLYGPSSGTATIYGHDIRKNMRNVRDVLGICPQHNVLFPHLTVREQLRLYAVLKGVSDEDTEEEVNNIMDSVSLWEKRDKLAETLSGGMKRRLSIGIALIGGSKFVILDEPTAGVDVNSRKEIWRLLLKHKKDRTILLSTHHMDEADVLADRIAILSEGKLKALGSSVYLKRCHGHSYTLILIKKNRSPLELQRPLDDVATDIKCRFVEETEEEMIYHIPIATSSHSLQKFFESLDKVMDALGFSSYGIQAPSLQQIFVSLAPQNEYKLQRMKGPMRRIYDALCCRGRLCQRQSVEDCNQTLIHGTEGTARIDAPLEVVDAVVEKEASWLETPVPLDTSTSHLNIAHARALFAAKTLFAKRSWRTFFFQIFLPVLLLLGAELYSNIVSPREEGTWPVRMVETFEEVPGVGVRCLPYTVEADNGTVLMPYGRRVPVRGQLPGYEKDKKTIGEIIDPSTDHPTVSLIEHMDYEYHGRANSALGPRSIRAKHFNPACYRPDEAADDSFQLLDNNLTGIPYNIDSDCGCHPGMGWTCTQDDYPIAELPYFLSANTTDVIRDLSGRNITQYRLITRFVHSYENMHSIIGGWSLGHENVQALNGTEAEELFGGIQDTFSQLAAAGLELGLNSTLWTGNSTAINDTFTGNITTEQVIGDILAHQDTKENVKVWFNNKVWPSLPIYYNSISNALLRAIAANNSQLAEHADNLGIVTFNHPMNRTAEDSFDAAQVSDVLWLMLAMFRIVLLTFTFCVIPAGFASFLVTDRESHSMHLQLVSGMKRKMYWSVEYIFDFMIFLLASFVVLGMYAIVGVNELTVNFHTAMSFLTLFLIYGLGALLLVFVLQRHFSIPSLAFVLISIGLFFIGVVTSMVIIVLEQLMKQDATLEGAYNVCSVLFLVLSPQYNLGMGVYRGSFVYQIRHFATMILVGLNREDQITHIPLPSLLEWDLMGRHVFALVCQAIVLLVIFCVVENGRFGILRRLDRYRTTRALEKSRVEEDEDVSRERERVLAIRAHRTEQEHAGLVVYDLAKTYGSHLAVKGVSFAVAPGECFGLLGVNGAGKTTTFGMLTGKEALGHGEVEMAGHRVVHGDSEGFRRLGYCPQFDALHMRLTTREQLVFYARIRGIPEHNIKQVVSSLLLSLHLRPYADTLTGDLSGGNKRKLSVAVALISQPPVILLDEPSAGMDPGSQQFLWTVVTRLRKAGRAVVLTSHSMEECEALCTRIAIMDDGRVRCVGSKQHLKTKFGEGYTLSLKTPDARGAEQAAEILLLGIPQARVTAIHCSTVFLHIPDGVASVAELLHHVNKVKETVVVEDFALSQTTLDDIFQSISDRSPQAAKYRDTAEGRPTATSSSSTSQLQTSPPDYVPTDPAPTTSEPTLSDRL